MVDAVSEHARERLLNEILYADDLVLMSENLEDLRERFQRRRDALESKGLRINFRKTKMMVSGAEGEVVRSRVDPCGICGKRVMSNAVWCTLCKKWIHARCTKMKKISCSFAQQLVCRRCEDIGEERKNQWRCYVMKWRLWRVFVILEIGWMLVVGVKLQWLQE